MVENYNELLLSELIILALAFASIILRIMGAFLKYVGTKFNKEQIFLLLSQQPLIIPLLIISSYFFSNDLGLPSILAKLLPSGYVAVSAHIIEIIRFGFTILFVLQEVGITFRYFESSYLNHDIAKRVFSHLKYPFISLLIITLIPIFLPDFWFFPAVRPIIQGVLQILLILLLGWLIIRVANAYEDVFLLKHSVLATKDFNDRSVATKIIILKKVLKTVVIILSLAACLLVFEKTRNIGASIFASVGIVTGIIGLAFRATLESFMFGLQIAFAQPIKLNDEVIIEGEAGTIEEISFSHVVVKLWDFRRLIVPTKFFIENRFLNFSRNSTNIIGSIFLIVDNIVPIEVIREQFKTIVSESRYWDQQIAILQVVEARTDGLQLRGIASSSNGGNAWNLKCEVLEELNNFIISNYPDTLSKLRVSITEPYGISNK